MALQIVSALGGKPIAVISDESKRQFCMDKGAVGVINRNDFSHWGPLPVQMTLVSMTGWRVPEPLVSDMGYIGREQTQKCV